MRELRRRGGRNSTLSAVCFVQRNARTKLTTSKRAPPPRAAAPRPSLRALLCEQVGGVPGARRARRVRRKSEAVEHEPNGCGVGDFTEDAQPAAAPGAGQDVHVERTTEQAGPVHARRRGVESLSISAASVEARMRQMRKVYRRHMVKRGLWPDMPSLQVVASSPGAVARLRSVA